MQRLGRVAGLLLALLLFATAAEAQIPTRPPTPPRPPADTVPRDTGQAAESARAAAQDTILQALLRLEGYTATEYKGETAVFEAADRVLRLRGSAEVERNGERLTADSIIYREETRIAEAYGSPKVSSPQAQTLEGEMMFYDLDRQRATVKGGRTQISQGATWFVQGDVTAEGAERFYTTSGIFTSDDRPKPSYHFQADRILMIRDRLIVARPARLYFDNVPVFWLPFLVQDLTRGRRSGLLTPRFGINDIVRTNSGYNREISNVGFYWAINNYMDAQIAGAWRSGVSTSLLASTQYRWRRQFLDGNFSYQQFWMEGGGRNATLSTRTSWRPDERTSLGFDANYATSSRFVRETSVDPVETRQDLVSNLSLGRRFDWGTVNLGGNRRQSILDDRVDMTLPNVGISLNTITLFREPLPERARWYNNASLTLSGSGSRSSTTGITTQQDREQTNLSLNQSLNLGNLSWSSQGLLNRTVLAELAADTVFRPRSDDDQGRWSTSLSYRQRLIGNTAISPNIQFSQEYRRNPRTEGEYLAGPTRLNFGASLSPDLYGFFPGVGPYSAIRHNVRPSFSYSYSPEVEQTELQDTVFGRFSGRAQNRVTLSLTQTFEAKLRTPTLPQQPADTLAPQPGDTLAPQPGDTLAGPGAAGAPQRANVPAQPQKVQILSITTSALEYDFLRAREEGETGFVTDRVSNSIRSDYLRGLNLDFSHRLFDAADAESGERGRFAPYLESFNASFSFGQDAALFRFLGGLLGRPGESIAPPGAVVPRAPAPGEEEREDRDPDPFGTHPPGSESFTRNPQGTGGGAWNVSLSYSLYRSRGTGLGTGAGGVGTGLGFRGSDSQNLIATITFAPTRNWSVNWNTSYSITEGRFGEHRLNLRRDLYRWQADIDFARTAFGNSAFFFTVRLLDLPDLKFDYRDRYRNVGPQQ